MNPTVHAQLSSRHRGGTPDDWLPLHSFMDSSKEVESSNAHRALTHHIFFIRQVMVPIFGATLQLTGGGKADVKDAMESDHVLADFQGKFLPSLSDYVSLVRDDPADKDLIQVFDEDNRDFYAAYPQVREHMLAPLANTGQLKSLLITHNSWWLNHILPKVFPTVPLQIKDFKIAPSILFNRMEYADWLNNGRGTPPSFAKIEEHRKSKRAPRPSGADVVFDGSRGSRGEDFVVDGGRPAHLVD